MRGPVTMETLVCSSSRALMRLNYWCQIKSLLVTWSQQTSDKNIFLKNSSQWKTRIIWLSVVWSADQSIIDWFEPSDWDGLITLSFVSDQFPLLFSLCWKKKLSSLWIRPWCHWGLVTSPVTSQVWSAGDEFVHEWISGPVDVHHVRAAVTCCCHQEAPLLWHHHKVVCEWTQIINKIK